MVDVEVIVQWLAGIMACSTGLYTAADVWEGLGIDRPHLPTC